MNAEQRSAKRAQARRDYMNNYYAERMNRSTRLVFWIAILVTALTGLLVAVIYRFLV